MKGSQVIVNNLVENSVEYVFGIPGNHILSIYDDLKKSKIKTILPTQEQSAGFMADVYGRVTRKPGVIFVTTGPGVLNLVNSVAQAYVESSPIVVFGAQCSQSLWGKGCYHELKHPNVQLNIFKEITKWSIRVSSADKLAETVADAFYKSVSNRFRPVFVEIPEDVFYQETDNTKSIIKKIKRKKANKKELELFFKQIAISENPVLIAGGGVIASDSSNELMEFSRLLNIPITTTIMGKSACSTDFENNLGFGSGILSNADAKKAIENSDLVIAIGTRFDEVATGFFTLKLHEKLIHIDIDKSEFNRNYKESLSIVADSKAFLKQAIDFAKNKGVTELKKSTIIKKAIGNSNFINLTSRVNPAIFLEKLSNSLRNYKTIFVGDAGYSSSWILGCQSNSNHLIITPSGYNSMGFSIPGAIGAKLGAPNSVAVAICGDGSFLMTGLELITAIKYKINIICIVLHDKRYNLLTFFQDLKYGGRYSDSLIDTLDFAKLANDLGALGIKVECEKEFDSAIDLALKNNKPTLIELVVDPNLVPPLLEKIKPPKK